MANQWNEKFINNQLGQLATRKTDDTNWKNKDLPNWTIFTDTTTNKVIDSLNQKFGTDWTILDKSFTENDSKYVVFAGNYSTGGFLLFTTKVFDEVYLFTEMQTTAPNRVVVTIPITHIYDFENDLYGQIFLITDNLDNKALQIISNPFVTDDIDLRMLLLTHNIVFEPKTYSDIKWKTDTGSQDDWNNFCKGIEWKLAVDISKQEYADEVSIGSYFIEELSGNVNEIKLFFVNYNYKKDGESLIRSWTQPESYVKTQINPLLDIKQYGERFFLTTNIHQPNLESKETTVTANSKYISEWEDYFYSGDAQETLWHTNIRDEVNFPLSKWNDLEVLNTPNINQTFNWAWDYYQWLKGFNGFQYGGIDNKIYFIFSTINPPTEYQLIPYISDIKLEPFYNEQRRGGNTVPFYKVELTENWINNQGLIDVNLHFKDENGAEIPDSWIYDVIYFTVVANYDETCYIADSQFFPIIGKGLFFKKDLKNNVLFSDGITQKIYVADSSKKLVTSTFTVTHDGTIDINTETNLIHQVDYSTTMFNVPSMINDTEMYMGFITQQKYSQIDYLLWHYEKIDPDKDDEKVVLDGAVKSINPLEKESTSIFTYYLKNEVIYRLIDNNNSSYIGLLYLKNNDRISNIVELNMNQKLFSYFKDDNSIQIRSIGDKNNWTELPYTSADETSIYFRQEQDNQIDNFNLTRISLLQDNFSLSDNNISNKNMNQVSAYVNIAPEMMNYVETNKISLINNNNVRLLTSDLILKKNQWENDLVGFNIKIKTDNEWKNFFNDPNKFQLITLKIDDVETKLLNENFSTIENQTLKIGFTILNPKTNIFTLQFSKAKFIGEK